MDYLKSLIISETRKSISLRSPAKINLRLLVLDQRPDGYHNLENLMHTINFCDEIKIQLTTSNEIEVTTSNPSLPRDLKNIAGKAAKLFLDATGADCGIRIYIDKRIPVGGGVGGGSSNAGTTLLALNHLLDYPLNIEQLTQIGILLGSDVPFFLHGGFAICTGKGEKVRPLNLPPEFRVLLVHPGFSISTAKIYEILRKKLLTTANNFGKLVNGWDVSINRRFDFQSLAAVLHNDLEAIAEGEHPELREIKNALRTAGTSYSMVTGSGSCVFGLCESRAQSTGVCSGLRELFGDREFLIIEASSRL